MAHVSLTAKMGGGGAWVGEEAVAHEDVEVPLQFVDARRVGLAVPGSLWLEDWRFPPWLAPPRRRDAADP